MLKPNMPLRKIYEKPLSCLKKHEGKKFDPKRRFTLGLSPSNKIVLIEYAKDFFAANSNQSKINPVLQTRAKRLLNAGEKNSSVGEKNASTYYEMTLNLLKLGFSDKK